MSEDMYIQIALAILISGVGAIAWAIAISMWRDL